MTRQSRLLGVIALVWLGLSGAWAGPKTALVLIYNAQDDYSMQIQLDLMTQLKALRNAGHFDGAQSLSTQFRTLDLNIPAYVETARQWGLKDVSIPCMALMATEDGKPKKLLWGMHVSDARQALQALDRKLGLKTPENAGIGGALNKGPVPEQGGPPTLSGTEVWLINTQTLGAVSNRPTTPTTFVLAAPTALTMVMTYHWNQGAGAPAGQLGLRHEDSTLYGPWACQLVNGVYWVVNFLQPGQLNSQLNLVTLSSACPVLKPGRYTVSDSSPDTWSHNAETGYMGITQAKGVRVSP